MQVLVTGISLADTDKAIQMAELIAIRTFIKLKVLERIPETGAISLQDLAKATGVQDSLLGSITKVQINPMKSN